MTSHTDIVLSSAVQCEICSKKFAPTKIQSHRQRCLRPARIKTTGTPQKKQDSLKIVKKKDYRKSVDGRYKCPFTEICSYTSRYGNNLAKHVRIHAGEKRYSCDFCDKRFTDPSSRAKHMLTHPESGAVKCKKCSVFFMPMKLEDHMISCKRNYAKQEPTNWCNKDRFQSLYRYFRESQSFEKKSAADSVSNFATLVRVVYLHRKNTEYMYSKKYCFISRSQCISLKRK